MVEGFVHSESKGGKAVVELFRHALRNVDVAYVDDADVASVNSRFGSQFCETPESLVAIGEEEDEVVEAVVCCLLSPLLGFILEVSLMLYDVKPLHHHLGLAGGDAIDAIQVFHDFSNCDELRGKVLVTIKGQCGITKGLQVLGVEDGFRRGVGDDVVEKSARMYFVVVLLGVLELCLRGHSR